MITVALSSISVSNITIKKCKIRHYQIYHIFSDLIVHHWVKFDGRLVYQASNAFDSVDIPQETLETISTGVSSILLFRKKNIHKYNC